MHQWVRNQLFILQEHSFRQDWIYFIISWSADSYTMDDSNEDYEYGYNE